MLKISHCSALLMLSVSLLMVASFAIANPAVTIKDTAYPIPASGVYFVSPAGNDTNAGTSLNTPFKTIKKAVQMAPSGSTIVIRAGTYRESITSLSKQLTFQPYPHEQVWLKGSVIVTSFVQDGSLWRKDNWTYKFTPTADTYTIDPAYPMAKYPDQAFIDGNPLTQVASKSEVGAGQFYVD